ncbi:MAG: DUF2510 domain-containing protein [Candidatus Nanopelagicales bacterium]
MSGPGWYADPLARAELRWYDGAGWREQVRTAGTSGTDALDPEGVPLSALPTWEPDPLLPFGPSPSGAPRGLGRGTTLALVGVVAALLLLGVVGISALLVLVRNTGALTTSDIEQQIGTQLGEQRASPVSVSCPPVIYLGEDGGNIECTATDIQTGAQVRIQVTIKRAKVTGWTVLDSAEPYGPPVPAAAAQGVA